MTNCSSFFAITSNLHQFNRSLDRCRFLSIAAIFYVDTVKLGNRQPLAAISESFRLVQPV